MSKIPDLVQDTKLETRFIDGLTVHEHDESDDDENARPIRRQESWERCRLLARGGHGDVWLQRCVQGKHKSQYRAVKVIARSGPRLRTEQYLHEVEAIAKFSQKRYSKCFVKLLGWYETADQLFMAMEYFPLGDLQCYLDEHGPMSEADVRETVFQVLEGLRYMHREGFAHRDIKPSNVLVKSQPPIGGWWVKLSDFGISKRLESAMETLSTVKGTMMYMAPEVFVFDRDALHQINHQAADMWSLGEMTFRMLTNSPTFSSLHARSAYLARPDLFPLKQLLKRGVSEEGSQFIRSLMMPAPELRLSSDQALAHTWCRPGGASPTTASANNKSSPLDTRVNNVGAAAPTVPAVTLGIASDPWATVSSTAPARSQNAQIDAVSKRILAPSHIRETVASRRTTINGDVPPTISSATSSSLVLEPPRTLKRRSVSPQPSPAGRRPAAPALSIRHPERAVELEEVTNSNISQIKPKGNEGLHLQATTGRLVESTPAKDDNGKLRLAQQFMAHKNSIICMACSADGLRLATGSSDETIFFWEADDDQSHFRSVQEFKVQFQIIWSLIFSPSGQRLVAAVGKTILVWQKDRQGLFQQTQMLLGHQIGVERLSFSQDGQRLTSRGLEGEIFIWEVDGFGRLRLAQQLESPREVSTSAAVFSPDGKKLAAGCLRAQIWLWQADDRKRFRQTQELEFTECEDNTKLEKGERIGHPRGELTEQEEEEIQDERGDEQMTVCTVAFSPDGQQLASGSKDRVVRIWTADNQGHFQQTQELKGHSFTVESVAFFSKGRRLISFSGDRTIIWEADSDGRFRKVQELRDYSFSIAFARDGQRLILGAVDGSIHVWQAEIQPQ